MSTTDDAARGGYEEASQRDSGLPFHPIAKPRIDPRHTPFSQTAAFRTYGVLDPDPFGLEDLYVKALLQEQGFDGLPHVVTADMLDRFVQAGEPQLFRGVGLAQYAEQFRRGRYSWAAAVVAAASTRLADQRGWRTPATTLSTRVV